MTNQDYKNSALNALSGRWPAAVVATLIVLLIDVAVYAVTGDGESSKGLQLVSLILSIGLVQPLSVGYYNAFRLLHRDGDDKVIGNMFRIPFGSNYVHVVLGVVLTAVVITVGIILFVIPGIIWAVAYSMVPYVLVTRPELSVSEAMKTSRLMMRGHKFDLFYLWLSFIGWGVLCILTLGIGYLWLSPYMAFAQAAFWEDVSSQYDSASSAEQI